LAFTTVLLIFVSILQNRSVQEEQAFESSVVPGSKKTLWKQVVTQDLFTTVLQHPPQVTRKLKGDESLFLWLHQIYYKWRVMYTPMRGETINQLPTCLNARKQFIKYKSTQKKKRT